MRILRALRALRSQRGSQIVEFALIAPIMLYLVLCIPVFSLFARSWIIISGAAQQGARAASYLNVANREQAARATVIDNMLTLDEGSQYFQPERDVQVEFSGDRVMVTVTYHQQTYLPLLHRILNPSAPEKEATVPLTVRSLYRVEQGI